MIRRAFRGVFAIAAALGGLVGMRGAPTVQPAVQQSAPAGAPTEIGVPRAPVPIQRGRAGRYDAQVNFQRSLWAGRPSIWTGAARSRHGRQFGPWGWR